MREITKCYKIRIPDKIISGQEIASYLTEEGKDWINGVGKVIVNSELFTSEEISLVTFEKFKIFCSYYGMNPYTEAERIDRERYRKIQIADFILNNDRHEQNWGFLMENETGKLTGYCPLFDHDHAFVNYDYVMSQITEAAMTLEDAAVRAQKELGLDLRMLNEMEQPRFLNDVQWDAVLERADRLLQI